MILPELKSPMVEAACKRYKVKELHLFGSGLGGYLEGCEDIDLLVVFEREGFDGAFDQLWVLRRRWREFWESESI